MKNNEPHLRSLAKSFSWRILGSVATVLLVFAYTGELRLSIEVGVVEFVGKIVLFYIHERVWAKLK
jgi:uncharacterized membrane protein